MSKNETPDPRAEGIERTHEDSALLSRAYAQADDRGLSPHRSAANPRTFTLACPKCRRTAIAEVMDGRVIVECTGDCVDPRIASAPHTGRSVLGLAYDPQALRDAAARPLPFVLDEWLVEGMVTVLAAYAGVGKSMVAGAIAEAVLTGGRFGDWQAQRRGPVLWLDAEQGPGIIGRRLQLLGLPDEGLRIVRADDLAMIRDEDAIEEAVVLHGARLLIVDSHRIMNPGAEENDSAAMAEAMTTYKRIAINTGCAVLVIHHSGKQSAVRGSSAIEGQTDVVIVLSRKDETDPGLLTTRWEKARPFQAPRPVQLRMNGESGRVVFTVEGETGDPVVDACMDVIEREGRPVRQAEVARQLGKAKLARSDRDRLTDAVSAGLLVVSDDGYGLPDRGAPMLGASGREGVEDVSRAHAPPLRGARAHQGGFEGAPIVGARVSDTQSRVSVTNPRTADRLPGESDAEWEARVDAALDAELGATPDQVRRAA